MTVPVYYIVADGNAYALDDHGVAFGAPVNQDGTVDWECGYDFDFSRGLEGEEAEYVIHMVNLLTEAAKLSEEYNQEVYVK